MRKSKIGRTFGERVESAENLEKEKNWRSILRRGQYENVFFRNKAVCRTALASPGLLKNIRSTLQGQTDQYKYFFLSK